MDTIRVLAADAVEKVGNGHPGTAMSLAPAAYLIYQKLMRHNPADPHWIGREWLAKTGLRERIAQQALAARPDVPRGVGRTASGGCGPCPVCDRAVIDPPETLAAGPAGGSTRHGR